MERINLNEVRPAYPQIPEINQLAAQQQEDEEVSDKE